MGPARGVAAARFRLSKAAIYFQMLVFHIFPIPRGRTVFSIEPCGYGIKFDLFHFPSWGYDYRQADAQLSADTSTQGLQEKQVPLPRLRVPLTSSSSLSSSRWRGRYGSGRSGSTVRQIVVFDTNAAQLREFRAQSESLECGEDHWYFGKKVWMIIIVAIITIIITIIIITTITADAHTRSTHGARPGHGRPFARHERRRLH